MDRLSKFGLSFLLASTFVTGCSGESPLNRSDISSVVDNLYHENGEKLNGNRLNGNRLNGNRLNGNRLNGSTLQTIANIAVSAAAIEGIVLETGAHISGPDFSPTSLFAELEDGSVAPVNVSNYSQLYVDGIGNMDTYLVTDPSTGQSICGNDDSGNPIAASPMTRVFDPTTGAPVNNSNLFTFACRFAALQKCNEYGYPDWQYRFESSKARSLAPYHDACVRMVRADYCGDGVPHTVTGTVIDIYDNLNINTPDSTDGVNGWYFEAEWRDDGAWCINKTRWMQTGTASLADNNSLANPDWAYIEANCPWRIAGRPWPGNPDGMSTPRSCGSQSDYNAAYGYNLADQTSRGLLRNNSKLYQH